MIGISLVLVAIGCRPAGSEDTGVVDRENARPMHRAARKPPARAPVSGHVATWDAALNAVSAVMARLEPSLGRLHVGGSGPMSLRVITRDTAGPEDAVVLQSADTCAARPSGIVCTASAIASILSTPAQQRPLHPVLLFLIAHELDHLRHGETGQFSMPPLVIKARSTPDQIKTAIRPVACATPQAAETRADNFARDVLGRAIAAGAFSDGGGDLGLTAAWVLNTMFLGAAQASLGGDRSTAALLDSTNVASDAEKAAIADRVLCVVAPGQRRDVQWQGFPGGYDTEGVRLTRSADRLQDELLHGGYGLAAHAGNLPDLLRSVVGIQGVMMRQNADLVTGVASEVCKLLKERDNPWRDLDCSPGALSLMPPSGPRSCPAFEAPTAGPPSAVPVTLAPQVAMSVRGRELHGVDPVTASAVRADGAVIAAVGDRGQIMAWRPPGPVIPIGEAGCRVGGLTDVGQAVVALCSRGEAVVRLDAGQRTTTRLDPVRVGGEPDEPEHIDVSWLGAVGGRVLAAVHQLGSGQGHLVEVTDAGLRSVAAWTGAGCDAVPFAVRVRRVDGALWASPDRITIAPQVLRLSAGFDRVISQLQPDDARVDATVRGRARGDVPIMACHASTARHLSLCTAMDGVFVDARRPLGPRLGAIVPAVSWAPGSVAVRSCGTLQADYLMVVERGVRVRVFALAARAAQAKQIWQAEVDADSADLMCSDTAAFAAIRAMDGSTMVALGGAP